MSRDALVEGWEWTRIQSQPCPQCGHDPAALPQETLGAAAQEAAAEWRQFLDAADRPFLRTSLASGVWSPLQYGAHSRDMLKVFADRIVAALAEDDPVVGWFDPGPEAHHHLLDASGRLPQTT